MPEVLVFELPDSGIPDFSPVFAFGQQLKEWLKRNPGRRGVFLNDGVAADIGSPETLKGLHDLLEVLQNMCLYKRPGQASGSDSFESIAFIEISLFDPKDSANKEFYTLLWGPSREAVDRYFVELRVNLEPFEGKSRGPIIPNRDLYKSAFYDFKFAGKSNCSELAHDSVFFGAYMELEASPSSGLADLRKQIGDFFVEVGRKCIASGGGRRHFNHAILCPVVRPSMQYGQQREDAIRGGGLFVYGQVSDKFRPEDFALSAAGLLTRSLLKLSMPATDALNIRAEVAKSWGHEMNSVARALNTQWAQPVLKSSLVKVELVPEAELPPGCIARVETSDQWASRAAILPYQPFVETLSELMSLWCMQATATDSPVKQPGTIRAMCREAWRFAARVAALFAQRNKSLLTRAELENAVQAAEDISCLMESCLEEHFPPGWVSPELSWASGSVKWNMTYLRILMALFMNCVKHADPSRGIHVHFEILRDETNRQVLLTRVENYPWTDREGVLARLRSSTATGGLLEKLRTPADDLVLAISRARQAAKTLTGYSSRDVVHNLADQLEWKIEGDLPGPAGTNKTADPDRCFSVSIRAPISQA